MVGWTGKCLRGSNRGELKLEKTWHRTPTTGFCARIGCAGRYDPLCNGFSMALGYRGPGAEYLSLPATDHTAIWNARICRISHYRAKYYYGTCKYLAGAHWQAC